MKSTLLFLCAAVLTTPLAAHAQARNQDDGVAFVADIGLSTYRYREPDVMTLSGSKIVAQVGVDAPLSGGYRLGAELRYADGDLDYRSVERLGSVRAEGLRDYLVETRVLMSREMRFGGARVRPFAGLGYRYLYNDARAVRGETFVGERRTNRLIYLPVGLALPLGEQLALRAELDPVLYGMHKSRLSDMDPSWSDIDMRQRFGLGAKLQLAYTVGQLRLVPYIDLWRVGKSDAARVLQNGRRTTVGGQPFLMAEPQNHTVEAGALVGYAF